MATIQLEHVTRIFSSGRVDRISGERHDTAPPSDEEGTGSRRDERGIVALDDVNLTVQHGETLSVIGPSGCGKSTLLRVIAGLEPLTSGRVLYDRQDVVDVVPGDRGIGIVFQSYALYPHMSSKNNMAFFFRMHKREMEIDDRVKETAAILGVGFDTLLGRMPATLSAGQKQRVALGRCVARDPKLILLDEPLSNLDAKLRTQTRGELKRLLHHFQVTSVYVTHDQIEAIALADRLAVMRWGRIEQIGSYWDVYRRPANAFVGSFVGTPPMNFLPVQVHLDGMDVAGVPQRLERPGDRYVPALPLTLGLRPEDVQLAQGDAPAIELVAEMVEYLPSERCHYVYSHIGDAKVTAAIKTDTTVHIGERVPVRLALENASYFDVRSGERVA
jgi:ABC-type sugar transport system ATPase subunit